MTDIASNEPYLATSLGKRKTRRIDWSKKMVLRDISNLHDPATTPGTTGQPLTFLGNTARDPHFDDVEDDMGVPNTRSAATYIVDRLKKLEEASSVNQVKIPMEEVVRSQLFIALGESYKRALASRRSRRAHLLDAALFDLDSTQARESQIEANLAPYSYRRLTRFKAGTATQ